MDLVGSVFDRIKRLFGFVQTFSSCSQIKLLLYQLLCNGDQMTHLKDNFLVKYRKYIKL